MFINSNNNNIKLSNYIEEWEVDALVLNQPIQIPRRIILPIKIIKEIMQGSTTITMEKIIPILIIKSKKNKSKKKIKNINKIIKLQIINLINKKK